MKKWVKVILIVSAVLILSGGITAGICLALGATWDDASVRVIRTEDGLSFTEKADGKEWDFSGETITGLDLSVGAGEMVIREGDHFRVEVVNAREGIRCQVTGDGRLVVDEEGENYSSVLNVFNWGIHLGSDADRHTVITVTIPKDAVFETIDISIGAGSLESCSLQADQMTVEVAAGYFAGKGQIQIRDLLDLSVSAGGAEIGAGSSVGKLKTEVATGSTVFRGMEAGASEFSVSLGSIEYIGHITDDWSAECDMGSIQLKLDGAKTDFNYAVECDMGTIELGNDSFSGMSHSRDVDYRAAHTATLECGMGSIEVDFK